MNSKCRGRIVSHKQNLVVRFVPALTKEDYCVYFFCIRCLEDKIAQNRVPGTYGGWRLGGKIRRLENLDDPASAPDFSYNMFAWKEAWTDYQKRAYRLYLKKNLKHFFIFDITNFYDSISLNRLEIFIRAAADKKQIPEVDLLFYFLHHWNKNYLNYRQQSMGIPQDEVGDCSRILANFYLQEYDKFIQNLTKKNSSAYLRFTDDQIIVSPNKRIADKLMFRASIELAKIGLNINAHKAKSLDKEKFNLYWSFDIFKILEDKNNTQATEKAFLIFKKKIKNNIDFRPDTVLRRFLNCGLRKLPSKVFNEIMNYIFDDKFLMDVSNYYLSRIYKLSNETQKKDFIEKLNNLSRKVMFNQFHRRVLRFAKENRITKNRFVEVERNLNNIEKYNSY